MAWRETWRSWIRLPARERASLLVGLVLLLLIFFALTWYIATHTETG